MLLADASEHLVLEVVATAAVARAVRDDEVIDVEMQSDIEEEELAKRLRFYHSRIDSTILRKREDFVDLRPVYVIFFCLKDAFGRGIPVYTIKGRCLEDEDMPFDDGATSKIVAVENYDKEGDPGLANLMRYIATNVPDESDSLTMEIDEAVEEAYEEGSGVWPMLTWEERETHARRSGERHEHAEDNRRYEQLMAKIDASDMSAEDKLSMLSGDLDEACARFGIE